MVTWSSSGGSFAMLAAALLLAGGLLALLASTVMPQAGLFVWAAAGLAAFLGVQLVVFRLCGLHSRADGSAERDPAAGDAHAGTPGAPGGPAETGTTGRAAGEWRAWRG